MTDEGPLPKPPPAASAGDRGGDRGGPAADDALDELSPDLFGDAGTLGYGHLSVWDEMVSGQGRMRAHWLPLMRQLAPLDRERMVDRGEEARRLIRQNGVTYNVYGDPLGLGRPWPLDLVPLMISVEDWAEIEAGVVQRARLLNAMLADLYGAQRLIADGLIPAGVVYGDAAYLRPCRGIAPPGGCWLQLVAFDLARGPDGRWRIVLDRTQAPSGAGYALENRLVLGRVMGDVLRAVAAQPLGPFFTTLSTGLQLLAKPDPGEEPRVVLLSPGPFNETYFEQAYLARHLGVPLVEGADLVVRGGTVYLKTIEGLARVHVILRRLDDDYCDPLELRPDSALGVAGLVGAARSGRVAIVNPLGSGLTESAALRSVLPRLAERLLGEPLRMEQTEHWWCGTPAGRQAALARFDRLMFAPAFARGKPDGSRETGRDPLEVARLRPDERAALRQRLAQEPAQLVAQVPTALSTGPVWTDNGLQPRPVMLRVFVAATPEGKGWRWRVMPGGLTRFAHSADRPAVSMQAGGGSKDSWVCTAPSRTPAETRAAVEARPRPGLSGALPSRAADGFYWLGRYAERADSTLALLRTVALRLVEVERPGIETELPLLGRLMALSGLWPADGVAHGEADAPQLTRAVHTACFDPMLWNGLRGHVQRMSRCAWAVRDRLAPDLWRIIVQVDQMTTNRTRVAAGPMVERIEALVTAQAALVGIEEETVLRGPAWRFLRLGRRLERALHLITLIEGLSRLLDGDPDPAILIDLLLELGESQSGYRERFAAAPEMASALGHLIRDPENPRGLAFQLLDIERALSRLPGTGTATGALAAGARMEIVAGQVLLDEVQMRALDGELVARLQAIGQCLWRLSDELTRAFFSHAISRAV